MAADLPARAALRFVVAALLHEQLTGDQDETQATPPDGAQEGAATSRGEASNEEQPSSCKAAVDSQAPSSSETSAGTGIAAMDTKPDGSDDMEDSVALTAFMRGEAVETMTQAAEQFIDTLAKTSHRVCELACRSHCNSLDVLRALECMGMPSQEVHAYASEYTQLAKASSASFRGVEVEKAENPPPFPETLPCVLNDPSLRKHRPDNMPQWLPDFPDPHTFVKTPMYQYELEDFVEWKRRKAQQNEQAQDAASLMTLRYQNSSIGPITTFGQHKFMLPAVITEPMSNISFCAPLLEGQEVNLDHEQGNQGAGQSVQMTFDSEVEADAAHEARFAITVRMPDDS